MEESDYQASFNPERLVECVQLGPWQKPDDIVWKRGIPKAPYHHTTYWSNDTLAMDYVWHKSNVVCFPGDVTQPVNSIAPCAGPVRTFFGVQIYISAFILFLCLLGAIGYALFLFLRWGYRKLRQLFYWLSRILCRAGSALMSRWRGRPDGTPLGMLDALTECHEDEAPELEEKIPKLLNEEARLRRQIERLRSELDECRKHKASKANEDRAPINGQDDADENLDETTAGKNSTQDHCEDVKKPRKEHAEMTDDYAILHGEKTTLEEEKTALQKQNDMLKEQNATLRQSNEKLVKSESSLRDSSNELKDRNKELNMELEGLINQEGPETKVKKMEEKFVAERSKMQEQIISLEAAKSEVQNKFDQSVGSAQQPSDQDEIINELQAKLASEQEQIEALTKENTELQDKVDRLNVEARNLSEWEAVNQGLKDEFAVEEAALLQKLLEAEQKLEKTSGSDAEHAKSVEKTQQLNTQLASKQKELAAASGCTQELESQLEEVQRKLKDEIGRTQQYDAKLEKVQKELSEATQSKQDLESQLEDAKKGLGGATERDQKLEAELEEARKKLKGVTQSKEKLEAELDQVKANEKEATSMVNEMKETIRKQDEETQAVREELKTKTAVLEDFEQDNANLCAARDDESAKKDKEKARADGAEQQVRDLDAAIKHEQASNQALKETIANLEVARDNESAKKNEERARADDAERHATGLGDAVKREEASKQRVATLEKQLKMSDAMKVKAETLYETVAGQKSELQSEVGELQTKVDTLQKDVKELREKRNDLLEEKAKTAIKVGKLEAEIEEKNRKLEATTWTFPTRPTSTGADQSKEEEKTAGTTAKTLTKMPINFGDTSTSFSSRPQVDASKDHVRSAEGSVDLSNPFAYNPTSPMLKKDEDSQDKTRAKSLSSAAKSSELSIFNTGARTLLFGGSNLSEQGKSPGLAGIPTNTFDFTAPSPRHKIDKAQQDKAKDQSTELPTQNPITPRGDWVPSQSFGALSPRAKKGHAPTDKMKETSVNLDDATTVNVPNMGPVPVPKSKLSEKLGKGKKKEDEEEQS